MTIRIIVSQFGDEFHVILEVAHSDKSNTRITVDIMDTEENAYNLVQTIQDQLNTIWQE